jgi:tetratricopeptide (TPR) repeat protein
MYTIGSSLYADEVALVNTQEYLEDQCRKRTETYFTKVKKVEKEISEQTGTSPSATTHKKEEEAPPAEQPLTYWDHFNRAYEVAEKGDHDTAIQEYTLTIEKDPTRPAAYNNRGISYRNLKEYEQAIQDYNKAIELDPNNSVAYNNLANSYYDLKQYEQAIEDYTKAIELNPNYVLAYRNRALSYRALKKIDLAEADEAKAKELDP